MCHKIIIAILSVLLYCCSSSLQYNKFYNDNKDKDLSLFHYVSVVKRNDNYAIRIYYDENSDKNIYFFISGYPDQLEMINTNQKEQLSTYSLAFNIDNQNCHNHAIKKCHKIITNFINLGEVIGTEIKPTQGKVIKFYLTIEDVVFYVPDNTNIPHIFKTELKEAKKIDDNWFYYKMPRSP